MGNNQSVAKPLWRKLLAQGAKVFGVLVCLILIWILIDLYGPWSANLRQFNATEIAQLETDMWRAYYDKKPLVLYQLLVKMLRRQNGLPLIQANLAAYRATDAAMTFKRGHQRSDYEQALPSLTKYFQIICQMGKLPANPEKVAKLELEWWIIHRERKTYGETALVDALAATNAELYGVEVSKLHDYAQARATAMLIRDARQEAGGVSEADWQSIDAKLNESYQALYQALN